MLVDVMHVRTSSIGNVDAIDGDSIVIITEGARKEYKISKSQVDGYNGAEVFLKLTIGELEKYRV
jgi:hypothetical protein